MGWRNKIYCLAMPTFVATGQTVAEIRRFIDFLMAAILNLRVCTIPAGRALFWWFVSFCKIWLESMK